MGRVTAQNGRKYTWNLASQLTSFADGVNSGTFTYDGLGEMSSSTSTGVAQSFVFNYLFQFPALSIVRQGVSDLRYYVYFPSGTLLYSIEAADNSRHFYHFDEMGNTVMLTGDSGAMTDSYAITPYGEIADHIGTTSNPFTWQGRYGVIQEGAGLYYLRSRHYDASAGRFISRDPVTTGDPRSAEPYIYARGNPLKFVDPLGNLSFDDIPEAAPLIQIVALGAALSGIPNYLIDVNDVQSLLLNAIQQQTCLDQCAAQGWELVEFIGNHNDLTLDALANLLTPPVPLPPPTPPKPTFTIGSSPMPVQAAGPIHGQPSPAKLTSGIGVDGLISDNGGGILSDNGAGIVSDYGNGLISERGLGVISDNSLGIVSEKGNGLISDAGGNGVTIATPVVSNDGGSVVSNDGGSVVSNDGGSVVSNDGGSVVAPARRTGSGPAAKAKK